MRIEEMKRVIDDMKVLIERYRALSVENKWAIGLSSRALCLAIEKLAQIANNKSEIIDNETIAKKALEDIRKMFPAVLIVVKPSNKSVN